MRLTWNPVPNVAWYEVLRNGIRIAATAVCHYEDPAGTPAWQYRYAVRAVNPLGRSGLSRAAIGVHPASWTLSVTSAGAVAPDGPQAALSSLERRAAADARVAVGATG